MHHKSETKRKLLNDRVKIYFHSGFNDTWSFFSKITKNIMVKKFVFFLNAN